MVGEQDGVDAGPGRSTSLAEGRVKYMLLIYLDQTWDDRSLAERQEVYSGQMQLAEELRNEKEAASAYSDVLGLDSNNAQAAGAVGDPPRRVGAAIDEALAGAPAPDLLLPGIASRAGPSAEADGRQPKGARTVSPRAAARR